MRQIEIQRMEFLQQKEKTAEGLNEKETERLRSLEAKLFNEQSKGGNTNGGQPNAGSDTRTTTRGVNSKTSGEVGREGAGNERGNGDESASSTVQTGGANDGDLGADGTRGRSSRTKSLKSGGSSGGSIDDSRGNPSDNGTGAGDAGRVSGSTGDGRQEESQVVGASNLRPKTTTVPKRKKATKGKKSNELDADMISALLTSGFGLIAKATARPHWEITEEEADSVAEPMEFLIDNMTAKQKKAIEKYSNPIMLASAVAGIVVPRIMIDVAMMKHNNRPKGVTQNVERQRTVEAVVGGDTKSDFDLGRVSENGGDSDTLKVASPVNDSVIAGLFSTGD